MTQTFTAVIHREGDLFVAECPEEFPIENPSRPLVTMFEVAVNA
jgi:hypothetical protein